MDKALEHKNGTQWNIQEAAENYDFGRPLNPEILISSFNQILSKQHLSFDNTLLFDAGTGTGRIALPLAENYPSLEVVGLDRSKEMLEVLRRKIARRGVTNIDIVYGDLVSVPFRDNHFDFTLISSVLHAIPQWQKAVDELARVTKDHGLLFLISEESDIYNIGLGRVKSNNSNLLERFWGKYIELREKVGLENAERSQVGIKWQLGCPEIISYVKDSQKGDQIDDATVHWQKTYTVDDFMRILVTKPWSSMFTADSYKYEELLSSMRGWLEEEQITHKQTCNSANTFKCEVLRFKK